MRVYNYLTGTILASSLFQFANNNSNIPNKSIGGGLQISPTTGGNCISFCPKVRDPSGSTFAVGFNDGVVRILRYNNQRKEIHLVTSIKPHTKKVTAIEYSPNGEQLACGSLDSTIFFFDSYNDYSPIGKSSWWLLSSIFRMTFLTAKHNIILVHGEVKELYSIDYPSLVNPHMYNISGNNL